VPGHLLRIEPLMAAGPAGSGITSTTVADAMSPTDIEIPVRIECLSGCQPLKSSIGGGSAART